MDMDSMHIHSASGISPIFEVQSELTMMDMNSATASEFYTYPAPGFADGCQQGQGYDTSSLFIVPPLYVDPATPSPIESSPSGSSFQTSPSSSYQASPADFQHHSPFEGYQLHQSPVGTFQPTPALGFHPPTDGPPLLATAHPLAAHEEPQSQPQSQLGQEPEPVVSVSSTFYPGANNDSARANLIFVSSDGVLFYVHYARVFAASSNGFNGHVLSPDLQLYCGNAGMTGQDPYMLNLPETSGVLNVLLHAVYNLSCGHYDPTFDTLVEAVRLFRMYGLAIQEQLAPSSLLYPVLLSHAAQNAMDLYILAAEQDAHALAVAASAYVLSFPLSNITDDLAAQMGPVYLRKLFFLHLGRIDRLKALLLLPLHPHGPTAECDFARQKEVERAWALATSYLVFHARADLPASTIESTLSPLTQKISCDLCKGAVAEKVKNMIREWSMIKRTIQ